MKKLVCWLAGAMTVLSASAAVAQPQLSARELQERGIPATKAALEPQDVPAGWEFTDVKVTGFRANFSGAAVVTLCEMRFWRLDGGGYRVRRTLAIYRPGAAGQGWVRQLEDELDRWALYGTHARIQIANLDRDMDDEIVVFRWGGGSAGDDTLEVCDPDISEMRRVLLGRGDRHQIADVDSDGRCEIVAQHLLRQTHNNAPFNSVRLFEPAVYVYQAGEFREGRVGFRSFYERELAKVAAQLSAAQLVQPSRLRTYRLRACAELVSGLRQRMLPKTD